MNFKNKNSWCEKDVSALYSHDSTVNAALYHVYFYEKKGQNTKEKVKFKLINCDLQCQFLKKKKHFNE